VGTSSARIYRQTFTLWHTWCRQHAVGTLELVAANEREFLLSQLVSKNTRSRQLSALRKLARVLALDYTHPAWRSAYESLLLLRVPAEGLTEQPRAGRALNPTETNRVLDVWAGPKLIQRRNQALVALLFLTGLRRSEAAVLRWADLDLAEGVLQVRHGKGDQMRTAAIAGELALSALKVWKQTLGEQREYVFCAIGKGSRLGPDLPLTDHAVYEVIKRTEQLSGVRFSPHDARRTFITEALVMGTPLADVQAQAGHKQASTTLRYAQPV